MLAFGNDGFHTGLLPGGRESLNKKGSPDTGNNGLDFSIAARGTLVAAITIGGVTGLIQGSPASPSSPHTHVY